MIIVPHLFQQFMHLAVGIQELWSQGKLDSAMEVLSRDIVLNRSSHHAYANHALVQACLRKWSNALADTEMVTSHTLSPCMQH